MRFQVRCIWWDGSTKSSKSQFCFRRPASLKEIKQHTDRCDKAHEIKAQRGVESQ